MKNYIKDFNRFAINEEDMGMRGRDILDSGADRLCMNITRNASPGVLIRLLNSGADPNSYDSDGRTPLQCAIDANNAEAIKILLDHGADPNQKFSVGRTGMTPTEYAEYRMGSKYNNYGDNSERERLIQMLIDAGAEF